MENSNQSVQIPYAYKPLSPWAYLGYFLLFNIPLVGFILLIVFSFSNENINRRNFARSYWCALLVCLIIMGIYILLGRVLGFTTDVAGYLQNIVDTY